MTYRPIIPMLLIAFSAAACSAQVGVPSDPGASTDLSPVYSAAPTQATLTGTAPATTSPATSDVPADRPATAQPSAGSATTSLDQPWATMTLTDVTTGEPFRLADLSAQGKVLFIETMATWCANCRAQQREAVNALAGLDSNLVEWIGLDIEATEDSDALARYSATNGFPFRYAIADRDLSRALADEFGDVVLSPPSVNLIVVGTDGVVTHLVGHHSADEIVALAAAQGV